MPWAHWVYRQYFRSIVDALNEDAKVEEPEPEEKKVEVEIIEQTTAPESDDDVKDAWDAESSESDSEEVSATSGILSNISWLVFL